VYTELGPLGSPGRRWDDNIAINLKEVGCVSMDWIDLAHDGQDIGTSELGN